MTYTIVAPDQQTPEHKQYIDSFIDSTLNISQNHNIIMGAKDIYSRHIISTDAYAKIVNLKHGTEVSDRFDSEMPCEGTAKFADSFVHEDQSIIQSGNLNANLAILNIHEYADGMGARIFCKSLLRHKPSHSVLGTVYYAHEVKIDNIFSVFDTYIKQFGSGCSISLVSESINDSQDAELTDYEKMIGFLLILKWDKRLIDDFTTKCRPDKTQTFYQSISSICQKAGLSSLNLENLRNTLIGMDLHKSMPKSLFFSLTCGN